MKKWMILLVCLVFMVSISSTATAQSTPKMVIAPKYDNVIPFADGLSWVMKGNKWGIIDKKGKEIVKPIYDDQEEIDYGFSEGLAKVSKGNKWGYINKAGKEVIPPKYDYVSDFKEGLAAISIKEKMGFIDKTGKFVIQPIFDEVSDFSKGIAVVRDYEPGYIQLIDKQGKIMAKTNYFYQYDLFGSDPFNEDLLWIFDESEKIGAIDRNGNIVIPVEYGVPTIQIDGEEKGNQSYEFSEGLAFVGKDFNRAIINKAGQEVVKLTKYDGIENVGLTPFIEGLAAFSLNEKWGFLDKTGNEVVPTRYDDIKFFSDGLAAVMLKEKWGFINQAGKEVVKPQYDNVESFQQGRAWVRKGGKWGMIDKTGKVIINPQYDDWYTWDELAYKMEEGLIFVKKGKKFGYIDKMGKQIISLQYDNAWYSSEGLLPVEVKGKWGYIANPLPASARK